jgi:(S)-ureidoglycine aminohydrolase
VHNLGQTRSVRRANHALHTPDAFVRAPLPGMVKAAAIVHASPALGAGFTQYTAEIEDGGRLSDVACQRLLYVLEGAVEVAAAGRAHSLGKDEYAYLPQGSPHRVTANAVTRLAVIEKAYVSVKGIAASAPLVGSEADVAGQALMGDPDLVVRALLPDNMAFDFAVNTMTYQPGAALSMVEMHVMEHGLLMLEGGGIYRLDNEWYAVTAGDFIWMGAYCPQWFGALGKRPAKYLILR